MIASLREFVGIIKTIQVVVELVPEFQSFEMGSG